MILLRESQAEVIRRALEKARLSLEWANGCFLTDRPDLIRSADDSIPLDRVLWKGDERKELDLIRQALEALGGSRDCVSSSRTGP